MLYKFRFTDLTHQDPVWIPEFDPTFCTKFGEALNMIIKCPSLVGP